MEIVENRPGHSPLPDAVHCGPVALAPGVRERFPVGLDPLRSPDRRSLLGNARAPVDHRTEDIERQGSGTFAERLHASGNSVSAAIG